MGKGETVPATTSSDRVCGTCTQDPYPGSYQPYAGQRSCLPATYCNDSLMVVKISTRMHSPSHNLRTPRLSRLSQARPCHTGGSDGVDPLERPCLQVHLHRRGYGNVPLIWCLPYWELWGRVRAVLPQPVCLIERCLRPLPQRILRPQLRKLCLFL